MASSVEFDPATSLPKRIEHFAILELLGQGAMGFVFRARDEKFQIDVALKMVKPELATEASARERFLREARAAAALSHHDQIVPVKWVNDVELSDGRHLLYLVMPLLEGETLQDRLRRGPLSFDEQLQIARHVAKGLVAAHRADLIHRDIKPANIWLESHEDGVRAKILDFGLARSKADPQMTTTGATMGTPAYMAPEQWDSSNVDHRADLWSFGVVLYQMATGRMPFVADTPFGLMAKVQSDSPETVRSLNPSIPKEYAQLISQLLTKKLGQRTRSASQVVDSLKAMIAISSTPMSETELFIPARKRRGRRLLIGSLLMALMLSVAVLVGISNRPAKGPTSTEIASRNEPVPMKEEPKNEEQRGVPPKRPALLSGDVTRAQIDTSRAEWANFYGVPLTYYEDLGNGVNLEMVFIPPGTYWMGSPEGEADRSTDEMQHEVTISEGFYIGKYEVTQEQYEALMGSTPSYFRKGDTGESKVKDLDTSRFPVESANWQDAQDFLIKLTKRSETNKTKRMYRLPREGEWEYICRGGQFSKTSLPFHFESGPQKTLSSTEANFDGNLPYGGAAKGPNLERTSKVETYKPNRFGIFGMHDNVCEWCEDWYDEKYYATSPLKDPTGPATGVGRVLRGGRWSHYGRHCRASYRDRGDPTTRYESIGFRVFAPVPSVK